MTTFVSSIDEEIDGENRLCECSKETWRDKRELGVFRNGILHKELSQVSCSCQIILATSKLIAVIDELVNGYLVPDEERILDVFTFWKRGSMKL